MYTKHFNVKNDSEVDEEKKSLNRFQGVKHISLEKPVYSMAVLLTA